MFFYCVYKPRKLVDMLNPIIPIKSYDFQSAFKFNSLSGIKLRFFAKNRQIGITIKNTIAIVEFINVILIPNR